VPALSDSLTYNCVPVLHEIRHALERLRQTGEPTIIDLTAMPFGPGDEGGLFDALGSGEVSATVAALGETRIRETSYAGVWIVEHLSVEERRLALHVEVADVPFLLKTPAEDLEAAQRRLDAWLEELAADRDTATQ
jgi:hydrogenase-1 operon protein HyaF